MNCPRCNCWNPPGLENCRVCHDIFFKTAAPTPLPTPAPVQRDWRAPVRKAKPYVVGLWVVAGIIMGAVAVSHYVSPLTRLRLYGGRLDHHVARNGPVKYLVGITSESRSWTEREEHIDTPLLNQMTNELGSVQIELTATPSTHKTLVLRAMEWIKTTRVGDAETSQTIAATHASLAPVTILVDPEGALLDRKPAGWRLNRLGMQVLPRFPKGIERSGASWSEEIAWTEPVGEWTIDWKADLHWTLDSFDTCYAGACAKLSYQAKLVPTLAQVPNWAKGAVKEVLFEGTGSGTAQYDAGHQALLSNIFSYSGKLLIPISELDRVPEEMRVGQVMSEGAGVIVIDFKNTIDLRNP